jgi:inorganic pyrophosphatase
MQLTPETPALLGAPAESRRSGKLRVAASLFLLAGAAYVGRVTAPGASDPSAGWAMGARTTSVGDRTPWLARTRTRLRAAVAGVQMVTLEEAGDFGTADYSMAFKEDGKAVSPWHDMPLELDGGLYNMLTEIPKMSKEKMEVDTKAPGNPIKQDEKKGKPRLYHGPIFWNYGCLPQTWEDPNVKGDAEVGGAFGDDDPVDVVEIGAAALEMGSFTPVKVLGSLSMIDDGELDWKVIAISQSDPNFGKINDVDDIEKFYPGTVSGIREWFRWYKTPDGKPINGFGHGERALNAAETKTVIAETNAQYKKLLSGGTDAGKLWLPSK